MTQFNRRIAESTQRSVHLPAGLRGCAAVDLDVFQLGDAARASSSRQVQTTEHEMSARRLIFRERDTVEQIPIVCSGWAACSVTLSDGRRQILAFLLPGDMAPAALVYDPTARFSVETVTDVQYRNVRRLELKAALGRDAGLFERFTLLWAEEQRRADQLVVDLGRRSADERVARLILGLVERMKERGLSDNDTIAFPLRQHHIADATGLTSVHVSKVLTEFRRNGLIDINDRSLTIADPAAMRAVANMR